MLAVVRCWEARRCFHVSGLLTWRKCAAGPNAFRGTDPDQRHAFEDALAKLGCSIDTAVRVSERPRPTDGAPFCRLFWASFKSHKREGKTRPRKLKKQLAQPVG